jgi:GNAT superfamily N-acetyltransferase
MIRELRADEWMIWKHLRLQALADAPDAFGDTIDAARQRSDEAWQESILANGASLFIAEYGAEPVGMVRVGRSASDSSSSWLYSMWVAPSARRRGMGRALMPALRGLRLLSRIAISVFALCCQETEFDGLL